MRCEPINRFLGGLPFTVVAAIALTLSVIPFLAGSYSFSCFGNVACSLATGALLYFLNKTFSFIRAVTTINVSVLLMLEAANPHLSAGDPRGSLMCIVMLASAFILFGSYNRRDAQRSIFITFVILMLGALLHYACLYLIPVFMLGFMQMRVMNFKGFLAMGVGLITPLWIILGLGIVSPGEITLPEMQNVWSLLSSGESWLLLTVVIASAVLLVALMIVNLMQIYSYKTQIRAYNGFFSVLSIATMIMMAADYGNILSYLPVLNCCIAVQVAHTFTISDNPRRFIGIVLLLAACVASYGIFYYY